MKKGFVAHYVIYLDDWFLEESVKSSINFVDKVVIARTLKPWNGNEADLTETEKTLYKLKSLFGNKVEIYEGEFKTEQEQRNFLIEKSKSEGYKGAFIIDADEIFLPLGFEFLYKKIEELSPDAIRSSYLTFIKDASFNISKPYETNLFYISLRKDVKFTWARETNTTPTLIETNDPGILHFSYLRKNDEDIWQKIANFMHNKDANWEKWYNEVYKKFNKRLKNFHPVWPETWGGLELFDVAKFPPSLYKKLKENGKLFYYERILNNPNLKLHLGCGDKILDGYINIDLYNPKADLNLDISDLSYFDDSTVSEIFMNAVFEHIYTFQQNVCLQEWKRVLKPGGKLRIDSIPDFDIYAEAYLKKSKGNTREVFDLYEVSRYTHGEYNEKNRFGQIHKDIFNKEKVRKLLTENGFEIEYLKNVTWGNEPIPCNINVVASKPHEKNDAILLAEKYLEEGNYAESEKILKTLLLENPQNKDALIDYAVLLIKDEKLLEAEKLLVEVLKIEPNNEIALGNFLYLAQIQNHKIAWNKIENIEEFFNFYAQRKEELSSLDVFRKKAKKIKSRKLKGICAICNQITDFVLPETEEINWREEITCPECKLNSRQRGALHYLITETNIEKNSRIYLTEQETSLFNLMKENFPNLIGSEFLGNSVPLGKINLKGIRNEDATNLTFPDSHFDFILSFEVLEHIPNYQKALTEFWRTLKNNGLLILTTPFVINSRGNIVKAFTDKNGKTFTIGQGEFHGDPLNPEKEVLHYYYFGWELLDKIKEVGFRKAFAIVYYSIPYGYLTMDELIIGVK